MSKVMNEGSFLEIILLAAFSALLGALGFYFPLLTILANVAWTVPVVIIIKKYTLKMGAFALIISGILMLLLIPSEPAAALKILIFFGPLSLLYGLLFKNKVTPWLSIILGGFFVFLSQGIVLAMDLNLKNLTAASILQVLFADIIKPLGLSPELPPGSPKVIDPETYRYMVYQIKYMVKLLLPGIYIQRIIFISFFNYLVADRILAGTGLSDRSLPPFTRWQLPWYFIWSIILGLGLSLIGDNFKIDFIASVGKNIIFVFASVFFVLGFSVMVFFYRKLALSKIVVIVLVIIGILSYFITIPVIIFIGLFDLIFDFRNLNLPADKEKEESGQ